MSTTKRSVTSIILVAAVVGAIASALLGLVTVVMHGPLRLSVAFGIFFAFFAVAKLALVTDALTAPPPAAGEVSRTQAFGSPRLFHAWLAYKIIAALIALFAAIYLLTSGSAAIDRFIS